VALLSLLQNTARIKQPRAAFVRRAEPPCPVKIGEPGKQAAMKKFAIERYRREGLRAVDVTETELRDSDVLSQRDGS
jgi:hypothetical protein